MALIPYEPFRHLENMKRELDRFFHTDFPTLRTGLTSSWGRPSIDIYETESEVVAACDLPGLEKREDVQIEIDDNVLSISGSINMVNEVKEEQMHRQERFVGRFQRSVTLPSRVDADNVKATYKNGVLEIRMPKLASETRRRIDVDFH